MKINEGIIVELVVSNLKEALIDRLQIFGGEGSFEKVLFQALLGCEIEEGNIRVSEDLADFITKEAEDSLEYYKIARVVAWSYMRCREDMPRSLYEFATTVILPDHKMPKKKYGPRRCNYFLREFWICHFADQLRNTLDINTYRNRQPKIQSGKVNERVCVCDLVARAFCEAGYKGVSYDSVETVLKRRQKSGLQKRIDEIHRALDARAEAEWGIEALGS